MRQQQWVKIKLYLPDGVTSVKGNQVVLPLNNLYGYEAKAEFELNTEFFTDGRLEFIIDISLEGRHSSMPVKVVLMRKE